MKPNQLKYGSVEHIRVRLRGSSPDLQKGEEVDLRWSEEARAYLLRDAKGVARVEAASRADDDTLHEICVRNLARVVWVADIQGEEILIQAHTFQAGLRLGVHIGIDEQTVEKAQNLNRRNRTPKDLVSWLEDQCLLPAGPSGEVRAFLSAGKESSQETPEAFALHGRSVRVHVKRGPSLTGEGEVFVVDRVVRSGGTPRYPIVHVEGDIQFTDATVAAWARGEGLGELQQLVTDGTSFLDLWKKYGDLEENSILNAARTIGGIAYREWERFSNGDVCFDVGGDSEAVEKLARLEIGDSIDAAEEMPAILLDPDLTWAEFGASQRGPDRTRVSFRGEIAERPHSGRKMVVLRSTSDDEEYLPQEGFLFPSIQGDSRRLERRREAEEKISSLQCSLPIAHLLVGARVPVPRRKDLPALTVRVREKLFGDHPPTPQQEEAIRVALNTPDIAVIQGPPGTGKTKVIEAIVERLNEELDTLGAGAGQILVTGFQHDAVENALNRIDVHGLPAIKLGRRQGRDEFGESESRIDRWVGERVEHIRERMPEVSRSGLHRWFASVREGYVLAPGLPSDTVRLLRQIVKRTCGEVSSHLLDRIGTLADEIEWQETSCREANPERETLERAVRALRVEPIGFADDGPLNAQGLLTRLRRQRIIKVESKVLAMLERAADWLQPEPPDFLCDLAQERKHLLLALVPDRSAPVSAVTTRKDVNELLAAACEELEQRYRMSPNAPDAVVADYLDQLENNLHSVRRAVLDYSSVFGATCQQAASKIIADVKPMLEYDTVLIDEAARSNPLDLFIPMVQARRRVILVGDHRQLPHIIDRQLEKEIEQAVVRDKSIAEETKASIEQSLFEHLYKQLGPEAGAEPRRVVTLNKQFRMHPVLGDFVSKEFYEVHDAPSIEAGLPEDAFGHELPQYKSRVAAWFNVPPKRGREKQGQSKSRPSEAEALAIELKRLLDAPAAKDLTFGCITFYSAQVECIKDALNQRGVVDGNGEVASDYRDLCLPDGQVVERLRIGTVDAFQGKEFDVVLLSVVRSNNYSDRDERARRRRYGHLMSPNRLCVSMSRQKRLLIVFGDPTLLEAPNAEEAIGPLVRFRQELCGGEHGRLV